MSQLVAQLESKERNCSTKFQILTNSVSNIAQLSFKYWPTWSLPLTKFESPFPFFNMAICVASVLWWKCSFAFNGDPGNFPDIFQGTHLNFVSQTHIIQLCHLRILCFPEKILLWRSDRWLSGGVPPPYPSVCPTTRLGEVRGSFSTKLTTGRLPHCWLVSRPTAPNLAPNSSERTHKSPGADMCQISHKWINFSPLFSSPPPTTTTTKYDHNKTKGNRWAIPRHRPWRIPTS